MAAERFCWSASNAPGPPTGVARSSRWRVSFVGSIKWRERRPFGRADAADLAARRADVPGADADTLLVGVSAQGFEDDAPLDVRLGPDDLIDAWRRT